MSVSAIILAGGSGQRFNGGAPKQYLKLAGKQIIEHTINVFVENNQINEIIIVAADEYLDSLRRLTSPMLEKKNIKVVCGGSDRMSSSFKGLVACEASVKKVLIHDAVRPFVSNRIISDCIDVLDNFKAVDVAVPSADTIIEVHNNIISSIPDRSSIMRGQTPQGFNYESILEAHKKAQKEEKIVVTDDCGIFKKYFDLPIQVVKGDNRNIKITYPEDLVLAEKLMQLSTNTSEDLFDESMIKDKVVVVFGGTSGIGLEISNLAKEYGSFVESTSTRDGTDITKTEDVKDFLIKAYEKHGRIDYIVNSAAILDRSNLVDRKIDDIKREVEINYLGNIIIAKEGIKYLSKTKGAFLFFTSSSHTRGRQGYSVYSSTKSAVVNLTQALSEEFYESGVRINAVCPERTGTPMRTSSFGDEPKDSLLSAKRAAQISLGILLSELTGQIVEAKRKIAVG